MMKKLLSRRGETLTELLISVLVIALGLMMFATAVMAARRMLELGSERVDTYYTGRNDLEEEKTESGASLIIEEQGKSRVNIGVPSEKNAVGAYPIRIYRADSDQTVIWRYGR